MGNKDRKTERITAVRNLLANTAKRILAFCLVFLVFVEMVAPLSRIQDLGNSYISDKPAKTSDYQGYYLHDDSRQINGISDSDVTSASKKINSQRWKNTKQFLDLKYSVFSLESFLFWAAHTSVSELLWAVLTESYPEDRLHQVSHILFLQPVFFFPVF